MPFLLESPKEMAILAESGEVFLNRLISERREGFKRIVVPVYRSCKKRRPLDRLDDAVKGHVLVQDHGVRVSASAFVSRICPFL